MIGQVPKEGIYIRGGSDAYWDSLASQTTVVSWGFNARIFSRTACFAYRVSSSPSTKIAVAH